MANQILIKRTATASKVPLTTDIVLGELALNSYDGKLFMKKNNGTADAIVEIGAVTTVAGRTGAVVLAVADVSGAAPLASPALTGTPTAPTATAGTSTTQIASTAFVQAAMTSVQGGAVTSANKWTTARSLSLTGDATGTLASVDGSADVSAAITLATVNTNVGAFGSVSAIPVVTVNGKGLVTAVSTVALSTTNVAEGTNLYFTNARASSAAPVQSVAGRTGAVVLNSGDITTALGFTPVNTTAVGAASGVASLDASGKIPSAQLPAIAITDTFVVATQAAMLALTAQTGDVAVRSDLNKTFILKANDPTLLANWQEMLTPTDAVLSVNGLTGAVTLTTSNITEGTNQYFTTARASAAAPVQSVAGRTGAVTLAVADVSGAAPLASPALTGTPTAPTAATADSSTTVATTAFVKAQNYITSAGAPVQSVAGRTGAVVLTTADISGTIDGGSY